MERRTISKEIYCKVVNEISPKILQMLPDTPENLLKYATRKVEIQYGAGITDEIKKLMKEKLLSDEEYLKTFYYVMAITFYKKTPVENPEIAIVAAQTGSGKSNLTAKLLRADNNYIFIDSDKYKHYRYDAREIAENYQVLYPFLTGPDAYDHADNIYSYALENNYNIIKETAPSGKKGLIGLNVQDVINKNYKISVHILAVGKLNSLLSIHERYELQIIHGLKTAKLTGIPRHNESYDALIPNVEDIMADKNISSIYIYKRGEKSSNYNPVQLYPSDKYSNPIDAINYARQDDNINTINQFEERSKLILSQMDKRNAPPEQYAQINEIKKIYEDYVKKGF